MLLLSAKSPSASVVTDSVSVNTDSETNSETVSVNVSVDSISETISETSAPATQVLVAGFVTSAEFEHVAASMGL